MRSFRFVIVVLAAIAATHAEARAQAPSCQRLLCAPVLLFQPGVLVVNAIDSRTVTAAGEKLDAQVTPLFRIGTVVPTRWSRVSLVAVVWYTPFLTTQALNPMTGETVAEIATNAPNFLAGPNFTLLRQGPLTVQFAVVDGYRRYEARDENDKLDQYRHNLILAPAVNYRFGALFSQNVAPLLRSLVVYGIWQQQVTNMPYNIGADGRPTTDRAYTPGLFFGVSMPIAPLP